MEEYNSNPETYLQTNSVINDNSNVNLKSKYGWVEVIGSETNVMVFCRAIVNDLTGKFELFQDESMNLIIFAIILGHPKIVVAVIKDVVYIRSLQESCAFKCDSVDDAQSWAKFLCYPMFSAVPITKPSECDWLYDSKREKASSSLEGEFAARGKTDLLQSLARQQIQFKITEMSRKKKAARDEKRKLKNLQRKKFRHQQVLKQRDERMQNNPKMKAKLESYRNRYDNIAELFRNRDTPQKPTPPPSFSPGKRELELAKEKRLARLNYENTLKILISNREQILREEMELNRQKLFEERQKQHEYSERRLLEDLLFNQKDGRVMTPTQQYEQMNAIVKIQALWRGATTRSYLESKRALMEIQSEILSTIESAQRFQNLVSSPDEDNTQSHPVGTFSSKAMRSLKELGYEIPSYFYSPSKPHEKVPYHPNQPQYRSPRKGVTYYDPSLHKNLTQPLPVQSPVQQSLNISKFSGTYQPNSTPSKFSVSSKSHPGNFSQTASPILQTNYSSHSSKPDSSASPVNSRKLGSNPFQTSSSSPSTGTYDHSSINPTGWNTSTSQNEYFHNHLSKQPNQEKDVGNKNLVLSDAQRMKLLTPVAENKSIKSSDLNEDPPHSPNYYLDRHHETSGIYQGNQQFASSASVLSDLTDDFGDGKVHLGENDLSSPSSHTSQSFPQVNVSETEQVQSSRFGVSSKDVHPQNSPKPIRNSILQKQSMGNNDGSPSPSSLPHSSLSVPTQVLGQTNSPRKSVLAPQNSPLKQDEPTQNSNLPPYQIEISSSKHIDSENETNVQKSSRKSILAPQPLPQPKIDKIEQVSDNPENSSLNLPASRKSILTPASSSVPQAPAMRKSFLTHQKSESAVTLNTNRPMSRGLINEEVYGNSAIDPTKSNLTENNSSSGSVSNSSHLKKAQSLKSMESLRSSSTKKSQQGFGVYIGTELVAHATTLEEIPILMEKITKERQEEERKRKEAEGLVNPPVTDTRDKQENNAEIPTPEDKKPDEADNNSVGSSKTAFEVWVGGKLIGVAKTREELPVIVAAAKAQEKLKRKLLKSKSSKKSLRSSDKNESRSKLQHSESNTSALEGDNREGNLIEK